MKRISFLLMLVLFVGLCNAQTPKPKMYVCVFADTQDANIGVGEEKNITNFTVFMTKIGTQLDNYIQFQDVVEYAGYDCSRRSLEDWVKGFSCGPNDVVVFAYMGHGAHSLGDNSTQFPQMCLGSTKQADFVNLEWVKNQLEKKNPRMCVVLGDCCNSYIDGLSAKKLSVDKEVSTVSCAPSDAHVMVLKKLFCDFQGSVIASGSKPGEFSWINTNILDKTHAGFFTDAFMSAVDATTPTTSAANALWEDIFHRVQQDPSLRNIRSRDGLLYEQHPIFKVDLKKPVPHADEPRGDRPVIDDTPLSQVLLSIGDDRHDRQERKNNVDVVLKRYFSDEALVYVVSESGKCFAKIPIKKYLSELSQKALFRGAVVRSVEKDEQGKITSFAIHEIYEKKKSYDEF